MARHGGAVVQSPMVAVAAPMPPLIAQAATADFGQRPDVAVAAAETEVAAEPKKKKAQAKKSTNQGKGGGKGNKFTKKEIKTLLTAVEQCLPIGQPSWKQVEPCHNNHRPRGRTERDCHSLKRKFDFLHKQKPATGRPDIPEEIREAKRIEQKIVQESEAVVAQEINEASGELVFSSDEDSEDLVALEVAAPDLGPAAASPDAGPAAASGNRRCRR